MLGSIHLQFVKNDQNNKTNINNTVCIASQKNIYRLYPPHSTSVNKEVIDDFGGNCNGDCVSEEKGKVLSSLYRIGIKREYPAEYKWQLHEAGTSRSQTYRKSNLVPRVFSLSNMAAAGEKTLAHSELKRSLIGAFRSAFIRALSLVYSFQNKDG